MSFEWQEEFLFCSHITNIVMAEALISTSVPRLTRKAINEMRDQLLTMNLNQEGLLSTGSPEIMRSRLMEHFYPTPLNDETGPSVSPSLPISEEINAIPSTSDTVGAVPNYKEKLSGSLVESITKEVKKLKVVPLREKLRSLGLDVKGLKTEKLNYKIVCWITFWPIQKRKF